MKVLALLALFAGASASSYGSYSGYESAPVRASVHVPITKFNHDIQGSLSSNLNFEAGNGIRQTDNTQVVQGRGGSYIDENGQTVQTSSSLTKTGEYSYTAPSGEVITTSWTADENGFRAIGAHLPTPPPIPADIAASLQALPVRSSMYSAPVRSAHY